MTIPTMAEVREALVAGVCVPARFPTCGDPFCTETRALLARLDGMTIVPAAEIEAMSGDAADLIDVIDEAAALRTALAHVLVRTHDSGCGTCDAARALLTAEHELPSRAALDAPGKQP